MVGRAFFAVVVLVSLLALAAMGAGVIVGLFLQALKAVAP
jgi:hypothetical protein